MDASQGQTDARSFEPLEPTDDGFRNWRQGPQLMSPEEALDMSTEWAAVKGNDNAYEGRDRKTDHFKCSGTRVDLIFGSRSRLRALTEVYGSSDAKERFVKDFGAAWTKVMDLDRYDLARYMWQEISAPLPSERRRFVLAPRCSHASR